MAKTVIHKDEEAYFGDKKHLEHAQNVSFSEMAFELLSEMEPTEGQLRLFDLILNLSIDHGPDAPSAVETIKSAKDKKTISESLAAGVLQINERHGGAIEPLMELLYKIQENQVTTAGLVEDYLKNDKRLPGFGHRIYKNQDPRMNIIFGLAKEEKVGQEYIEIVKELEKELESQKGKKLPINIDGSIAPILCGFGWSPKLGKAVFLIARTPGLLGQFLNNS
jgi:citrate synthase